MRLPQGKAHQIGGRRGRQPASVEPRQYINPIQLSLLISAIPIGSAASNLTTRRRKT
jgi:hypothetical protein